MSVLVNIRRVVVIQQTVADVTCTTERSVNSRTTGQFPNQWHSLTSLYHLHTTCQHNTRLTIQHTDISTSCKRISADMPPEIRLLFTTDSVYQLYLSTYLTSALLLLAGRQEGHPACKKLSDGALAWLSVWSTRQTCIWPSWCHCHSLSLAPVKSRLVLPLLYRLTQVVREKRPLNGSSSSSSIGRVFIKCVVYVQCNLFMFQLLCLKTVLLPEPRTGSVGIVELTASVCHCMISIQSQAKSQVCESFLLVF